MILHTHPQHETEYECVDIGKFMKMENYKTSFMDGN